MSTEARLKNGVFRCFMGPRAALNELTWLLKWRVLRLYTRRMPRRQSWPQSRCNRMFGCFAADFVTVQFVSKTLFVQINRAPAPHTSVSRHLGREKRLAGETISCVRFPRLLPRLSAISSSASQSELLHRVFQQAHLAIHPSTRRPPCASAA